MREVNADNAGMGSEAAVQVVQACCLHCQQVRDYQPTTARLTLFTNTSMVLEYFWAIFWFPLATDRPRCHEQRPAQWVCPRRCHDPPDEAR